MKFNALIAQLANRINQPHVIEIYLRLVFDKGSIYGREIAKERHAKELQELKDKAVGAYKECCSFQPFVDLCPISGHERECVKCRHLKRFIKKLNEQ